MVPNSRNQDFRIESISLPVLAGGRRRRHDGRRVEEARQRVMNGWRGTMGGGGRRRRDRRMEEEAHWREGHNGRWREEEA